MGFRYIALIALWTLVSGPILGVPTGKNSASASRQVGKKVVKAKAKQAVRR